VLQVLPTHLSLAEIAARLYVSRNTIKAQTIAIYRKLGTSSRSGAVELARAAGLLETTSPST
jgi:LuxR family maltose regulon positive regulatory protein